LLGLFQSRLGVVVVRFWCGDGAVGVLQVRFGAVVVRFGVVVVL
jgi:hypothetical protein